MASNPLATTSSAASAAATDAGAGAEALLGLAAGAGVCLPRLSALPDHASERAGPEPPPLALPTSNSRLHPAPPLQQTQPQQPFLPTPPTLSLPGVHPPAVPPAVTPTPQVQQQPQQTHSHFLATHHLPQPHELQHRPQSYLPPPPPLHGHDLPSVASLAEWAPPSVPSEPSAYRSLPAARPTYDPLQASPPRLSPLTASAAAAAVLSQHLAPTPSPWDAAAHRPTALPTPSPEYAAPHHHWPPPTQHAYPYHAPPPGYYYYPGAHPAPQNLPQPQLPPPSQTAMQLPAYSIPRQLHQQPVISPMPPPLALPLPVPRVSAALPPALRAEVSSMHDVHALRQSLPGLDPAKFMVAKDNLLAAVQERAAMSDVAVAKVPDIATGFGPALQANLDRRGAMSAVLGPSQFVEPVKNREERGKQAKTEAEMVTRPSRGRGIADLMNPTDTLPGASEPEPELAPGMKKLEERTKTLARQPIPVVPAESVTIPLKSIELAEVKKETTLEPLKPPAAVAPQPREAKKEEVVAPEQQVTKVSAQGGMGERHSGDMEEVKSESDDRAEDGTESEETRCPCGSKESAGVMIACDQCNTWQHSRCMGFGKAAKLPSQYYCHICRPGEMRPNCVVFRKYKEKMIPTEKEPKDLKREFDPILAVVRPLELRKLFAADLILKKTGHKLSKGEVFHRYATLLRNQFAKYRQSVVDGIVVLLDLSRTEVGERLDSTLKRIRAGAADKASDDSQQKRQGAEATQEAVNGEASGSKPHGHGRNQPPKRLRPSSISLDNSDEGHTSRGEVNHANDPMVDIDADPSTSRAMSREERKLQQTMKLFARLEEQEREREKKRPRAGESGGSPKTGHPSRPKTPRPSPQAPAVSPKGSGRQQRADSEECKGNALSSNTPSDEKQNEALLLREKQRKEGYQQQDQQSQQDQQQSQPQLKPARKGAGVMGLDLEPATRDQPKREREHKNRDKSDRVLLRRKDTGSPDAASAGNGRRRGILERERSQDRKRRRIGTLTREAERRYASERDQQTKRDSSLDFKLFVPGRSVLGSRMIPKERLSKLERERLEAEESAEAHSKERGLPSKKHHLMASLAEKSRAKKWETQSPAKRRYRVIEKDLEDIHLGKKEQASVENNSFDEIRKKTSTLSVSMVLVSERGKLPDKGQMFESSRLVLPESKEDLRETPENKGVTRQQACLKKRARMFPKSEMSEDTVMVDVAKVPPSSPKIKIPPSSPPPRSPSPCSPRPGSSLASPRPIRSPMLRSSPAPRVQGLRSVSPPAVEKASNTSSPLSSPRSGRGSPAPVSSQSPSPHRKAMELTRTDYARRKSSPSGSPSGAPSKDRKKVEDMNAGKTLSFGPLASAVPLNRPKPPSLSSGASSPSNSKVIPTETKKALLLANGIGLRSVRSVPIPEARKAESSKADSTRRPQKDSPKEAAKAGSPISSPRRKPLPSAGISDIFQQRLQGFLKPAVSSPREPSSGIGLRSGIPLSQSSRASAGIGRNIMSGHSESANGALHGALPSFKSKTLEKNSWRTSFPVNRRPYGTYGSAKSSPTSGSLRAPGGKVSPVGNGDNERFRAGRLDTPGRSDDSSRTGTNGPHWNNRPHKNGWTGGNGRAHQPSNDASAKANRRGRH